MKFFTILQLSMLEAGKIESMYVPTWEIKFSCSHEVNRFEHM